MSSVRDAVIGRKRDSPIQVFQQDDESSIIQPIKTSKRATKQIMKLKNGERHHRGKTENPLSNESKVGDKDKDEVENDREESLRVAVSSCSSCLDNNADTPNAAEENLKYGMAQQRISQFNSKPCCRQSEDSCDVTRMGIGLEELVQFYTGVPLQYRPMPSYSPLTPPTSPRKRKWSAASSDDDIIERVSQLDKLERDEKSCRVELSLLYPDVE